MGHLSVLTVDVGYVAIRGVVTMRMVDGGYRRGGDEAWIGVA